MDSPAVTITPDEPVAAAPSAGVTITPDAVPKPEAGPTSRFLHGFGSDLWNVAKGMKDLVAAPPQDDAEKAINLTGPGSLALYRMGKGYVQAVQRSAEMAKQSGEHGDVAGTLLNSAAAGLPVVGPLVSGVYEKAKSGDVAGAAGMGASRILQAASMAPEGSPIPNPLDAVKPVADAVGNAAGKIAPRLYQSALKPPTTMNPAARSAAIDTGLSNSIPVSAEGFAKIHDVITELNDKVQRAIQTNPNAPINKFSVASRLGETADRFRSQVNPNSDLNAISKSGEEFLDTQPGQIPAATAQQLKVGTYQQLSVKAYGELKSATVEAQKALARGLKEELETQFPEIKGLNAQESHFYGLEPLIARAVGRISNHEMLGIGTPIAGGAAAALTGSKGAGVVLGTIKAVVDNPAVKSRLAIMLSKASRGSITPWQATMRVNAYANALKGDGGESQE